MDQQKTKKRRQLRRRRHVRSKIVGTAERPRLTVHRTSKHVYVQLIDDINAVTLAAASSRGKDIRTGLPYGGNIKGSQAIGKKIAEVALAKGIKLAAFDRGHFRYHGRIKALADAAREGGLQF